jgi:hypothetical protein
MLPRNRLKPEIKAVVPHEYSRILSGYLHVYA